MKNFIAEKKKKKKEEEEEERKKRKKGKKERKEEEEEEEEAGGKKRRSLTACLWRTYPRPLLYAWRGSTEMNLSELGRWEWEGRNSLQ